MPRASFNKRKIPARLRTVLYFALLSLSFIIWMGIAFSLSERIDGGWSATALVICFQLAYFLSLASAVCPLSVVLIWAFGRPTPEFDEGVARFSKKAFMWACPPLTVYQIIFLGYRFIVWKW